MVDRGPFLDVEKVKDTGYRIHVGGRLKAVD